ncbi:prolipoprotein diacylglyceryl transferase [Stenotrophobium rhamnosiphilum]|uniref:Phosphatidylglycerol--prolipoprotein diacylglyceryl transferase n=1 Tax=Stenotrophobium rhamnosiphilum TaxID=2029166 RepID=A0A2T5MKY0_9GAMM|nr:prolipoprotein diacylglyceryl transferase [Stenotrophobium rhamnosiphilum]PTU33236.1 prolipoprotein diacylglyceryl transferase [Stenotrophobium rhamnosiphilum]
MLIHPDIDPVAIHLGPLAVRWYGLMYLLGFWGAWWLALRRARMPHNNWPAERVGDLLFYVVMGVILGGRIGYTLFYNFDDQGQLIFLHDPMVIFRIWEGGMSFHGGLIGVIVAYFIFAWQRKINVFEIADFAAPVIPIGLFTGRIGNFINGELWGAPTTLPWGMVFKHGGPLPRHPSMLYEAALEGLLMFAVLYWFASKPRPRMAVSGLFLVLYSCSRVLVETVRTPDVQLGYLFGTNWITMGMTLSAPMFVAGTCFLVLAYTRRR